VPTRSRVLLIFQEPLRNSRRYFLRGQVETAIIGSVKPLGLHWWIFAGILAGVVWGWALHRATYEEFAAAARAAVLGDKYSQAEEAAGAKKIQAEHDRLLRRTIAGGIAYGLSSLFTSLLRMIVIPLVFVSLVCGVAGLGDPKRLGRLGLKTLAWYLTTSLLAILTGMVLVNLIRPGVGVRLQVPLEVEAVQVPESLWDLLLKMVPSNPIKAAAEFDLFPVIFFALLFGIFTLVTPGRVRDPVVAFFQGVFEIMMKMTMFVIALAPVGIAALIARHVAASGLGPFTSLLGYVGTLAVGLAFHSLLTLPLLFWLVTRRSPYRVLRAMAPALLTAFSTASSASTLPITMQRAERGVGVSGKVSAFVLPLGATVNMDGTALYECVAVIFLAQVYGAGNPDFTLTPAAQATIVLLALMVSIGAAGIPHAGLVMMVIILQALGLPLELVALLWAVDRPLDMCRTAVNVWSDSLGAAAIAHTEGEIDESVLFDRR